jgi:hypothetical protein
MITLDKSLPPPPLMLTLTSGHIRQVFNSPLGELTNMVRFIVAIGSLWVEINLDDMNE